MAERVLLVDDEPNILDGYRRGLRRDFDIETAAGPALGLAAIESSGPFAVVVSDYQMPKMNGIEFLGECARRVPDTVRIMLTGQADLRVASSAVNEGSVFRFLTKPCGSDDLASSLSAAIDQNRLIRAERELIEGTLNNTVTLLSEVIGLLDPETEQHNSQFREFVSSVIDEFPEKDRWQIELAARLTQVGSLTLPTELRRKIQAGQALNEREAAAAARQPEGAFKLLKDIPRLDQVAEMIKQHGSPPSSRPTGAVLNGQEDLVAGGAHALYVAATYQAALLESGSAAEAAKKVDGDDGNLFRKRLVRRLLGKPEKVLHTRIESIGVERLIPDMVVNEDVRSVSGTLLLGKGHRVTAPMIQRLERIKETVGVVEPFSVTITVEGA